MCWSSSTVRNSPIAWRGGCAPARRRSRSSTMCARRCGPGGRDARAPCALMSIMCWRCCRSSRRRCGGWAGRPARFVGHPLSERVASFASECRGGAPAAWPIRRCCWCCRAAAPSEIRRMAGVFGDAVALVAERVGALEVVVPAVPRLAETVRGGGRVLARSGAGRDRAGRKRRRLPHGAGGADQVRHLDARTGGGRRADGRRLQGVAAGGTDRPPADQGPSVILANLVLGENVVPEFLQRALHAGAAGRRPCAAIERYAGAARGRSRPSPGSMPSWISARRPPATAPPPWSWIAPAPLTNRSAKQWHPRRQQRSLPLVQPDGLMPWPLTGITAFDHSHPRRDYRRPWLSAAGPAHQCGTGAHGGHQRRLDHRAHRHQGTPHPEGRGARHLAYGGGSGARPVAEDRHQAGGGRPADLRDHHAGHAVPVDRQSDLRHGRHPRYRQLRRAGGLLGLSLFADHRLAIHRQRHRAQGGGGGRRQDVVDHRLHRPRHLRAVRRRRRRRAAGAERRAATASWTR